MKKQIKTETVCKNTVATECATGAKTDAIEPRASCVFYSSWHEAIGRLPQKDQLNAYKMILDYSLNFVEPEDDGSLSYMIFVMAKPSIESAEKRYNESVEIGKTGGRPSIIDKETVLELSRKGMKPSEIARKLGYNRDSVKSIIYRNKGANANLNVNDNETDNVNDTDTETEKENIIIIPSFESIDKNEGTINSEDRKVEITQREGTELPTVSKNTFPREVKNGGSRKVETTGEILQDITLNNTLYITEELLDNNPSLAPTEQPIKENELLSYEDFSSEIKKEIYLCSRKENGSYKYLAEKYNTTRDVIKRIVNEE
jgi:hypothetical protein